MIAKAGLNMYKIDVYLPKEALGAIIDAVKEYAKADSDKYIHCMSWYKVHSMWKPLDTASPYLGEVGKDEYAEEYVLTFRCEESVLEAVKSLILQNHPYEVACIDVYKLL